MTSDRDVLCSLLRLLVRPQYGLRRDLTLGALEEAVAVGSGVIAPFLLKHIVDGLGHRPPDLQRLAPTVVAFVATWSAGGLLGGLTLSHTSRIVERLASELSVQVLHRQLPRLASGAIESQPVFAALERLPFSLQVLIDGLLWRLAPMAFQILASVIAVAWLTPRFALCLAATLVVYAVLADRGSRQLRRHVDVLHAIALEMAHGVGDVLSNARRVIFNGALSFEEARFTAASAHRQDAAKRLARSVASGASVQYFTLLLGLGGILVAAGVDVAAGRLSVGAFVLLQAFAFRLSAPLASAAQLAKEAVVAVANLRTVVDLAAGPAPGRAAARVYAGSGQGLAAVNLTYTYPGATSGLHAVTLHAKAGSFVVLVGPNGAGKSTLARILGGVQEPQKGEVQIAGASLYALGPEERIKKALYVPQSVSLLDRSLQENGLYPPSRLSAEQLMDHLKAWRFFDGGRLTDLSLTVGEGGRRLSGGQIQKLELARLIGVSVPLLVLDETTAALDPESERRAITALRQRSGAATLLLVTHDRALTESADQVWFLESGRDVIAGPHAVLWRTSARYRAFWEGRVA